MLRSLAAALLLLFVAFPSFAQERRLPEEGGHVFSLGLPGRNLAQAGLAIGALDPRGERTFSLFGTLGTYRDLIHPAYSIAGLWPEIYMGYRDVEGGELDGGARAMLMMPQFRIGGGVDYNISDDSWDSIFTLMLPFRRAGVLGHGSWVRLDWLPSREHSFYAGVNVALQRYAGETRPRRDHVRLPKPASFPVAVDSNEALQGALANVRDTADWIDRLTVPFLDHKAFKEENGMKDFREVVRTMKGHMASTSSLFPNGRTIHEEVRVYHEELDRAFSIAATGSALEPGESNALGREVSAKARELLLDEVIIRYDRLLGQRKKDDSILGFAMTARGLLARWLNTESSVSDSRKDSVLYVFETLIETIEALRKRARDKWNDSRLVWIPMQFALRPEQHDSQEEMNRLIEKATQREFTEGNQVLYLINEKFQVEVHRHIREAEDYHVLWIHDFRGVNAAGDPDEISFRQVVDSYLAAMTAAVRKYDETGKLPLYLIVQDQFYYENNKAKRWMDLLQAPLDHRMKFPKGYEWMTARLDSAQAELREAVEDSQLLQTEAREYGQAWLENRVKVHVSITNPADPSYWSQYVMPIVGVLDCYIRDHRKISFYDVTEDDPFKGDAIYTGMGIGEHYIGPTWEDRAIRAKGPAVLDLKYSCRDLLLRQGFTEDELPFPLRIRPKPRDYDQMIAEGVAKNGGIPAVELHNVNGYGPKRISVFKAIIYTMMPPGSVLLMPDFVWQAPLWGSMAAGGALRGTRSLIVFPALGNQPSPSGLPQSRARELFRRLIEVQNMLGDEIAASGGLLKTGFYKLPLDVKDLRGRVAEAVDTYQQNEWLVDLVHGTLEDVPATVAAIDSALAAEGFEVVHYVDEAKIRQPQLHMKAQFFCSGTSWDAFFSRRKAMKNTGVRYAVAWARQLNNLGGDATEFREAMDAIIDEMLAAQSATPEETAKGMTYLSVGSQNMDYRGLFLDGEVAYVATKRGVIVGFMDLLHVIEVSDWIDDTEKLDEYMGSYGWLTRHLGRLATPLM